MASWYVIFTKLIDQNRVMGFAQVANASFWNAGTVQQGAEGLEADSPFRYIAEKGLEGASKHTGLLGAVDFNTWVTMSIQRAMNHVQSRTQDGLAVLATVGFDSTLCRTLWHGLGHLQRARQNRHVRPSQYRQSGGACR
jgi:biopolymer transport protein ExbB